MKRYHLLSFVLVVILALILVGCLGTAATKTVTQTQSQTITETQTLVQTQTTSIHQELSTSEILEKISPVVAYIETYYGIGTGTVIDERGYLLTNNHVVEEEDYATVRLPNRQDVIAEVVYRDQSLDIAILKCPGTGYSHVALGSIEEPDLLDDVIAFGHPVGEGESASISKGIISSLRTVEGIEYIQTDAAANPGSSGGPLVNTYGEFIGIVTWGLAETEGINFAIDVNSIKTHIGDILQQLIEGGISIKTVTQTMVNTVTVTTTVGVGQIATVT